MSGSRNRLFGSAPTACGLSPHVAARINSAVAARLTGTLGLSLTNGPRRRDGAINAASASTTARRRRESLPRLVEFVGGRDDDVCLQAGIRLERAARGGVVACVDVELDAPVRRADNPRLPGRHGNLEALQHGIGGFQNVALSLFGGDCKHGHL